MSDRRPTVIARVRDLERQVEILSTEVKALRMYGAKTRALVKDTMVEYEFLTAMEQNPTGGVVPPSANNAKAL